MNVQGVLSLIVAAACILAIGATSTTLDAVETDPHEVLPEELIINPDEQSPDESDADPDLDEDAPEEADTEEAEGAPEEEAPVEEQPDEEGPLGGGGILSVWQQYLELLVALLVGIIALVLGFVLARRRFDSIGGETEETEMIMEIDTSNGVYESWWEMVEEADIDSIQSKTPQEIADEAVDAGLDPEPVSELTQVFEEVYYGGKEITRGDEKRAREAVERIKSKSKGKTV